MALPKTMVINKLEIQRVLVPIRGTAPLIVNRFTEKTKAQLAESALGKSSPKRARDPMAEVENALYRLKDKGFGFPAIAFKAATISGARFYSGPTMTFLRQCMFFGGEIGLDGQTLVRIEGEPSLREDGVGTASGGRILRFRPQFIEWSTVLDIKYIEGSLPLDSLVSLIGAGGVGVGVGDWRIEKNGDFGTYAVDETRELEIVSNEEKRSTRAASGTSRPARKANPTTSRRRST